MSQDARSSTHPRLRALHRNATEMTEDREVKSWLAAIATHSNTEKRRDARQRAIRLTCVVV